MSTDQPIPYAKGDRCRILGDFKVEHYDCDEWGDGVVTDVRTGKRVVS